MTHEEKIAAILDRFPFVFPANPNTGNRPSIGVGPGWLPIVAECAGAMQSFVAKALFLVRGKNGETKLVSPPQPSIELVRQKLGTCRFLLGTETWTDDGIAECDPVALHDAALRCHDQVEGMIFFAEYLTSITCETCGRPGNLVSRKGFLATRCPECAKKENFGSIDSNKH